MDKTDKLKKEVEGSNHRFTDGPWAVDGFNVTSVIKNEGSETWPQWKHICDCNYGYMVPEKHFEENKANARLISVAPSMLRMLMEILPMLNDYANTGISDKEYRDDLRNLIYSVKSTIKNANEQQDKD